MNKKSNYTIIDSCEPARSTLNMYSYTTPIGAIKLGTITITFLSCFKANEKITNVMKIFFIVIVS